MKGRLLCANNRIDHLREQAADLNGTIGLLAEVIERKDAELAYLSRLSEARRLGQKNAADSQVDNPENPTTTG